MRASATSRIASSAQVHAAQAKDNANKTDEASPFALLLDSTAHAAKPSHKDARDSGEADDKTADDAKQSARARHSAQRNSKADAVGDKAAAKRDAKQGAHTQHSARHDNKAGAIQATTQISARIADKADKADRGEDKKIADNDLADAGRISATEQQMADTPPNPAPPAAIAARPASDDSGRVQADAAAPVYSDADSDASSDARDVQADAATAQASVAAAAAQASVAATAAQASASAPTAQTATAPAQASVTPAATQAPSVSATAQVSTAPITAQTSAAPAQAPTASAQPSDAPRADDAEDSDAQALASIQAPAKSGAKPAAPETKADAAKPLKTAANAKAPSADNSGTAAQTDTDKPDTGKTADGKPNLPPTEIAASSEAAKPAPQPVQAANNSGPGVAALQAPQPATAPTITQHVQVTALPVPNLPALAVSIAAKSQSGARQFDIRLDPPELGRVEVRLSIDATGKASAHLSADKQQTLDLLQKDAPALTRALRDAGLDVSQDGLNFSLRQGSQDSNANNGGSRGSARNFNLSATTSIDATATSAAYRSVADGRLDIRV